MGEPTAGESLPANSTGLLCTLLLSLRPLRARPGSVWVVAAEVSAPKKTFVFLLAAPVQGRIVDVLARTLSHSQLLICKSPLPLLQ